MNDTLTPWAWSLSFKTQWLLCDAMSLKGFPGGSDGKESTCNAGDLGWIPGLGRCPRGGHGKPLQYSCLENPHGQRTLVGFQSMGLQRVGHDWATKPSTVHVSKQLEHMALRTKSQTRSGPLYCLSQWPTWVMGASHTQLSVLLSKRYCSPGCWAGEGFTRE